MQHVHRKKKLYYAFALFLETKQTATAEGGKRRSSKSLVLLARLRKARRAISLALGVKGVTVVSLRANQLPVTSYQLPVARSESACLDEVVVVQP